ncbi:MAG: microcin C ABC transporter permease YejB [Alphaproteobacteria bacterium]
MTRYIIRRLLFIIPTLIVIMAINFVIVQATPGGPIEQMIAQMQHMGGGTLGRVTGGTGSDIESAPSGNAANSTTNSSSRAASGLDPDYIAQLERQYGFDKPLHTRFFDLIISYAKFDFGESYYQDRSVLSIILDKMPVSISLGLWSTLLIYLISIPLGIAKAVRMGTKFDLATSIIIITGYAIPNFLFAVLLIILFAGGEYFSWFPLRGLVSDNWHDLGWYERILDYLWHLTLPLISIIIGGFATLTMLTRNSFLEEISKHYVQTARAKGLDQKAVLYRHVFRNAMLIVIAGFPAVFIGMFFTSTLLTEIIFSLDGLGLLGFEAAIGRDYPIMFATLYIFSLMGLVLGLLTDLTYVWVDPRIDFERKLQ